MKNFWIKKLNKKLKLLNITSLMFTKFQDLIVWRKAVELYKETAVLANYLPKEELDCLGYQLRKSSLGVSSNIASGSGRGSNQNFKYFLFIALGNLKENESCIILGNELKYFDSETMNKTVSRIREIERMICSLIEKMD